MQILSWAKLICNLYSGEVGKDEEGAKKADLEACSKGGRVWGLHRGYMALEAVGMQMLTFCVRMCAIFEGGEEVLG